MPSFRRRESSSWRAILLPRSYVRLSRRNGQGDLFHLTRVALQSGFRAAIFHLAKHHEPRLTLNQGANSTAIKRTLDGVASPMPRQQPGIYIFRAIFDLKR